MFWKQKGHHQTPGTHINQLPNANQCLHFIAIFWNCDKALNCIIALYKSLWVVLTLNWTLSSHKTWLRGRDRETERATEVQESYAIVSLWVLEITYSVQQCCSIGLSTRHALLHQKQNYLQIVHSTSIASLFFPLSWQKGFIESWNENENLQNCKFSVSLVIIALGKHTYQLYNLS